METRSGVLDAEKAAQAARAETRRGQLLNAAARLMESRGSQSVSMQALATEAGVSVGLIYRYFKSKEDLLFAVITDVLDAFAARVPLAVSAAGPDPVERLAAAFQTYCTVIEDHRHAAVLTYRESKSLSATNRERIKELEIATSEPLRSALADAVDAGLVREEIDVELVAYDLLLLAHAWALKHWYFERTLALDEYVNKQISLSLHGILEPKARRRYARLLDA